MKKRNEQWSAWSAPTKGESGNWGPGRTFVQQPKAKTWLQRLLRRK